MDSDEKRPPTKKGTTARLLRTLARRYEKGASLGDLMRYTETRGFPLRRQTIWYHLHRLGVRMRPGPENVKR
jgi:hypothetical protein